MKNFNNPPISNIKLDNLHCPCQLPKECIFKRIKYCTEIIEKKIIFDKIYGFELLNYIIYVVEEFFKEYDAKDQDTLIVRIHDNIERGRLGNIIYF
jgi:hypothetical protein